MPSGSESKNPITDEEAEEELLRLKEEEQLAIPLRSTLRRGDRRRLGESARKPSLDDYDRR